MDWTATVPTGWDNRAEKSIRIRRTDGSNRIHEATCTEGCRPGVGLSATARFAVGEVVELLGGDGPDGSHARRARVLFRRGDVYGLDWLPDPAPEVAPDAASPERLAAARKLLEDLKTAYHSLSLAERRAVRRVLHEQAA